MSLINQSVCTNDINKSNGKATEAQLEEAAIGQYFLSHLRKRYTVVVSILPLYQRVSSTRSSHITLLPATSQYLFALFSRLSPFCVGQRRQERSENTFNYLCFVRDRMRAISCWEIFLSPWGTYSVCSTITKTSITNDILYVYTVPGAINRFRRSANRAAGGFTTAG